MHFIRKLWRSERASFTLESSLIFPTVLIAVVAMLFFCMLVYKQTTLYYDAARAAGRMAYTWDNSYKAISTGAYYVGKRDGLYWRQLQDRAGDLFGLITHREPATVTYYHAEAVAGGNSLVERKLSRAAPLTQENSDGTVSYTNHWLKRSVTVSLRQPFHLPDFLANWLGWTQVSTAADAAVTEPAEFVRSVDLVRNYAPVVNGWLGREKAGEVLAKAEEKETDEAAERNLLFSSHNDARAYLQRLVGGVETHFSTEKTGKYRKVDALDRDGIAHEVFYGYKAKTKDDINLQLEKDLELLRTGKIKGAVWHFFRSEKNETIGPSGPLRKKLEKNGIIIVIHGEIG